MVIEAVSMYSPDLNAQRDFYTGVPGFPVETDSEAGLTLRVGSTLLRFVPGEIAGPYHLAFNVPEDRLAQARAWLEERIALLANGAGETTFHSDDWNGHALYFRDADGNILEFIARHSLPAAPGSGFSVADVLGVSELGLPVANVPEAVCELQNRFELPIYGEASPTFTPLGDEEGLLIVVPVRRGWFPTGEPAHPLPFQLRAHSASGPFDLEERP